MNSRDSFGLSLMLCLQKTSQLVCHEVQINKFPHLFCVMKSVRVCDCDADGFRSIQINLNNCGCSTSCGLEVTREKMKLKWLV